MNTEKQKLKATVIKLVKNYETSIQPEKYINGITNYERGLLRSALGLKEMFPKTWKTKI